MVLSVVEVPGNVVGGLSAHYFGRRLTSGLTLAITAVFSGLASTAITGEPNRRAVGVGMVEKYVGIP